MGEKEQPKKVPKRRKILAVVALLLVGFLIGTLLTSFTGKEVTVPQSVRSQINFPIFVPGRLPGNFEVSSESFAVSESALIFSAEDGAGGRIIITEQARPADFDFAKFYSEQIVEAQTLNDVPFPSVVGKSQDLETRIVSIVTPDTWILANSRSTLTADDFKLIAKHIKQHQQ